MLAYLYALATDRKNGCLAGVIKPGLWLLSLFYSAIVSLLAAASRCFSRRLPCKVVSVGNITLGGTGKTALVEYIARALQGRGHRVAVLSRGYKRDAGIGIRDTGPEPRTPNPVSPAPPPAAMGDEPAMLKKNLPGIPVIVDKDRMRAAAKAALEYRADTVVLDDGMQQWGIKKDLEVVAVDSGNPFGNRCLIPRGILREPLSALRRADIFVLTKTNLYPHSADTLSFLRGVNPVAEVFCAEHAAAGFYTLGKEAEMLPVQSLQGKAAAAFCGIGDPESFKKALCALGARTELFYSFPDHYQYRAEDLRRISAEAAQRGIDILVTTEKDAARLANLQLTTYNLQLVFVLRIQLRMINEQRFLNRLSGIYLP